MNKYTLIVIILLLALLAVFSGGLRDRLALNLVALDTVHILYSGQPLFSAIPPWLSESRACSAHWMAALQSGAQGNLEARNHAYLQAAACDQNFVTLIQRMHPEDVILAQMTLEVQPASATSWFWVGDLQPEKKIEYYQQGLAIDPQDGLRWLSLGEALQSEFPEQAMEAYLNACQNGDPGYHACSRAGMMAEQLGYVQKAIQFYRLSSYSRVREKADILESKLTPAP